MKTVKHGKYEGKRVAVTGYIDYDEADLWCDLVFTSDRVFYLNIEPGSALVETDKMISMLSDQLITQNGLMIGYDKLDGRLPGGKEAYVTVIVKPYFVE